MEQKNIRIFIDGACLNNGSPSARGGWGAILINCEGRSLELSGPLEGSQQTNNRAELFALIKALQALNRQSKVAVFTDSKYVQQGCSEWLPGWKSNFWQTSAGKPVANVDLWIEIDELLAEHEVSFTWVRGHNGHFEQEMADALAKCGAAGKSIKRRCRHAISESEPVP